jgi:hypothetical protein
MTRARLISTLAAACLTAVACQQVPTSSGTSSPSAPAFDGHTNGSGGRLQEGTAFGTSSGGGTPTDSTGDNRGGQGNGSGG